LRATLPPLPRVMNCIEITPLTKPIDADITVPGSKSLTNRALVIASLAKGKSRLTGALFSDDTGYMHRALEKLGVNIEADEKQCEYVVCGNGGQIFAPSAELYIGNAGTAARFLASYVALGVGEYVIDGDKPMRTARPFADLLYALHCLGVRARSVKNNNFLPIQIQARGIEGGRVCLNASKSSQFLTSLMLIAPYTKYGLEIEIAGELKTSYIDITLDIMRAFGVNIAHENYRVFRIAPGHYTSREYQIEPDASSASYFFAAAALTGGRVRVNGITCDSAQGDIHFVRVLEKMGCSVRYLKNAVEVIGSTRLKGIQIDMKNISDTSLTLAAIAPFAETSTIIRNIEHTRFQETDRVRAMATELKKLGVSVEERRDGVTIHPSKITPGIIETYNDHRVAMSFALIGLRTPGIIIKNPACVSKTFPDFFERLASL